MDNEEFEPIPVLSEEDKKIVNSLTDADIEKIDSWLLDSVETKWRKVAYIVAQAMALSDEAEELLDVPDLFFGYRVEHLVEMGVLESRGDLKRMRYCEVRRMAE